MQPATYCVLHLWLPATLPSTNPVLPFLPSLLSAAGKRLTRRVHGIRPASMGLPARLFSKPGLPPTRSTPSPCLAPPQDLTRLCQSFQVDPRWAPLRVAPPRAWALSGPSQASLVRFCMPVLHAFLVRPLRRLLSLIGHALPGPLSPRRCCARFSSRQHHSQPPLLERCQVLELDQER